MIVVKSVSECIDNCKMLERPIGLVPTMGALHEGHLSLVSAAKKECKSVVVSIFVNPTQFSPTEDLSKYPRPLEKDLSSLEAEGVDLVWTPTDKIMYKNNYQTWVEVIDITKLLEGKMRPDHFKGVTTVVSKLFNAVRPDYAYFGQKDAQQSIVIKQMVSDLNYPIEIRVCPIIREEDNLAKSSRNIYLDPQERKAAPVLYKALNTAKNAYSNGERNGNNIRQIMLDVFNQEPKAKVQYISCADLNTLEELEVINNGALISVAVYIGKTRLIDNMILD